MKVFIVGGTGFIGYYSALEFLNRGHSVTTISLPDIEIGEWFPKEVEIKYGNVFEMSKTEITALFLGFDAVVYAVGPDDRVTPKAPAYEFFHERLVEACSRVVSAAKSAGIKKCVVMNSYFAYFDRVFPQKKLSQRHSYIKCRIEQAERVISEGGNGMDVMVLELPYIFGTMPERVPLWKDILVKMLYENKIILYPKGGSNMISIEHVAEAVAGAVERGQHGRRYPIGDANLSWVEMLKFMLNYMNMSHKRIITLPCFLVSLKGRQMKREARKHGLEAGLNPIYIFKDILCKKFYFDPSDSAAELGYGRGGIQDSIKKTIEACIKDM